MRGTYNGGKWTKERFNRFIISALRKASMKWPPRNEAKKNARVARGMYKCDNCGVVGPATIPPKRETRRRRNNSAVDHVNPVVDPANGFIDWNTYIDRMFCELEGFQVLCWECHDKKSAEEREARKKK